MNTQTLEETARIHRLRETLKDTRFELGSLIVRPLEFLNSIGVSRENGESYIDTMLAQERSILRQLNDPGFRRDVFARETEQAVALNMAANTLRAIACQPSGQLSKELRLSARIISKAATIPLRDV